MHHRLGFGTIDLATTTQRYNQRKGGGVKSAATTNLADKSGTMDESRNRAGHQRQVGASSH
jgi:hypothetical protein